MRRMITFEENHVRFTNRIVGIALDRDRVLLHRTDDMDFWALPGGRAELLALGHLPHAGERCCGWLKISSKSKIVLITSWVSTS